MAIKRNSLLLSVNEKKPLTTRIIGSAMWFIFLFVITIIYDLFAPVKVMGTIAWFVGVIGAPLFYFFFSRYRFELNEEGVKFKPRFGRHYLYRWNSFRSYTVDSNKKRFVLKREGAIGTIQLDSTEKFSEIERILSERISASGKGQ